MKKFIFFVEAPFNTRDYQRFGIEVLRKRGFEVEVWDMSRFLQPELKPGSDLVTQTFDGYQAFADAGSAVSKIVNLPGGTSVLALLGYSPRHLGVLRALSRGPVSWGSAFLGSLPPPLTESKPSAVRVCKKVSAFLSQPRRWGQSVLARLSPAMVGVRPMDFVLLGGTRSCQARYPTGSRTRKVWCHSMDYDLYLQDRTAPPVLKNIVFLDEFGPFHPDYASGLDSFGVSAENYYPKLCQFFSGLEEKLKEPVVIAAHPRSEYHKMPDFFGGRKVVHGETQRLVKEARHVIAHASTALNFVNLYEKPVTFVLNKSQIGTREGIFARSLAQAFGRKVHFLEDPVAWDVETETRVDTGLYRTYRENFIKRPGSPEKPCWEIVADYLEESHVPSDG